LFAIDNFAIYNNANAVCFNKGTKILCLNSNFEEEYIEIENLKRGDLVKTFKHGYRKIDLIASGNVINNPDSKTNAMYKMVKTETNGLFEDLILTGGHSILVDKLSDDDNAEQIRMKWGEQKIDDKSLLLACVSKDFQRIQDKEIYYYYHFILENSGDDHNDRYGVYANGILTETPVKRYFVNQLNNCTLKLI
jgi:hypothetical protein